MLIANKRQSKQIHTKWNQYATGLYRIFHKSIIYIVTGFSQTFKSIWSRESNTGIISITKSWDYKTKAGRPWPDGSVDWNIILYTKRLRVRSPVRAHTYVAVSVSTWCVYRRQPMFLFLKKSLLYFFHYHLVPLTPSPCSSHHLVVHGWLHSMFHLTFLYFL